MVIAKPHQLSKSIRDLYAPIIQGPKKPLFDMLLQFVSLFYKHHHSIYLGRRCVTLTLSFKVTEADRGELRHRNILVPKFHTVRKLLPGEMKFIK